jgi:hypothetical protein
MNSDPGSLDRLHDIVLPDPTPWWPPAPGWLWLLGLGAVMTLVLLLRALMRWQRNRYRREALAELAKLEASAGKSGPGPAELLGVAELLKRVALTAWPRDRVATLTGPDWFAFLDRSGGTRFSSGLGAALEAANYGAVGTAWDAQRFGELTAEARRWIRRHRVVPEPQAAPGQPGSAAPAVATGERKAA